MLVDVDLPVYGDYAGALLLPLWRGRAPGAQAGLRLYAAIYDYGDSSPCSQSEKGVKLAQTM